MRMLSSLAQIYYTEKNERNVLTYFKLGIGTKAAVSSTTNREGEGRRLNWCLHHPWFCNILEYLELHVDVGGKSFPYRTNLEHRHPTTCLIFTKLSCHNNFLKETHVFQNFDRLFVLVRVF